MNQIHQELKELTATPRTSTAPPQTQQNVSNLSIQRPETQATSSAEETLLPPSLRPTTGNLIPPTSQTGITAGNSRPSWHRPPASVRQQPLSCWTCGLPGHLSRDCQQIYPRGPPNSSNTSSANQTTCHGSKKNGISNVYVKLKLAGKEVSCLVDSGCDITLVPKDLIKLFRSIEMKPTTQT